MLGNPQIGITSLDQIKWVEWDVTTQELLHHPVILAPEHRSWNVGDFPNIFNDPEEGGGIAKRDVGGSWTKENHPLRFFHHITEVWVWTHEPQHHSCTTEVILFCVRANKIFQIPEWDLRYCLCRDTIASVSYWRWLWTGRNHSLLQGWCRASQDYYIRIKAWNPTLHPLPIHTVHPSCQSIPGHAHISHMKILETLRGCVFRPVWKESNREDLWPWRADDN